MSVVFSVTAGTTRTRTGTTRRLPPEMEAAGEGLVETASDTSSLELGSDTTPSSPTSSQEGVDGIESAEPEDSSDAQIVKEAVKIIKETLGSECLSSMSTSSQEEFLEFARVRTPQLLKQRLREYDVLNTNISTCEVINVLGVNKDKLEEIREVHRWINFLGDNSGTQEDKDKWTEIGLGISLDALNAAAENRGGGGNWIVSAFI